MERNLPAAVTQCFSVVILCTSVADPNWITVRNGTRDEEDYQIFGVTYVVHLNWNVTGNPDSAHLLTHTGIVLLVGMALCCYVAILTGLSAFLIDFIGAKACFKLTYKVPTVLHSATAILCAVAVVLCCSLFALIVSKLKDLKLAEMYAFFGESFYFAIGAACISSTAAGLRICRTTQQRTELHPVQHSSLAEETTHLLGNEGEDHNQAAYT
ncbi:transmembrane protein 127-like [Protopterus annectens]|uniref:transmembrane protein 127-like n=1 Tax=Protopterus annectens TaxID=7888 RepID=UPI001CF9DB9A|nr:transmembrane protein 127-like [Protopterus annectens]